MTEPEVAELAAADPWKQSACDPATAALIAAMADEVRLEATEKPRWSRRKKSVLAASAAAVIVIPALAAANGSRPESIDFGSPEAPAQLAELTPRDLPLPAGRDWQSFIDVQIATQRSEVARGKGVGPTSVGGVRQMQVWWSRCSWEVEWIKADNAGDTARRAAALKQFSALVPEILIHDGGGVAEAHREIIDGAEKGNGQRMRDDVAVNCDEAMAGEVGPVVSNLETP